MSRRREFLEEARNVQQGAVTMLQPMHEELLSTGDTYDGMVHFVVDEWHEGQAAAAVSLQPEAEDGTRHDFFNASVRDRRVDLGATALGIAFKQPGVGYLPSRMNHAHTTWATPTVIDGKMTGGVQAAFRHDFGSAPSDKAMRGLYQQFNGEIKEVAYRFSELSRKARSIGDAMEFSPPITPNAYVLGWDSNGSSEQVRAQYGTYKNYLLAVKNEFPVIAADEHRIFVDDTGDGQHLIIRLPDTVDRGDSQAIKRYYETDIEPLVNRMRLAHRALKVTYADINPEVRFAIGLAAVEHDERGRETSPELWEITETLKNADRSVPVALTEAARRLLSDL